MNKLILSKESSTSEIKRYFNAVLKLSQSDDEFPINLEDVWMLVYSEKSKAVRALRENFIENVDFITVAQNGEGGKFARTDYYLTVNQHYSRIGFIPFDNEVTAARCRGFSRLAM